MAISRCKFYFKETYLKRFLPIIYFVYFLLMQAGTSNLTFFYKRVEVVFHLAFLFVLPSCSTYFLLLVPRLNCHNPLFSNNYDLTELKEACLSCISL